MSNQTSKRLHELRHTIDEMAVTVEHVMRERDNLLGAVNYLREENARLERELTLCSQQTKEGKESDYE